MRDEQKREIDETIDGTARALTGGQPPAALRAHVAQRIARPHRRVWRAAWPLGAAAAALVIVALFWPFFPSWLKPAPTMDSVLTVAERQDAPAGASAPSAQVSAVAITPVTRDAASRRRVTGITAPAASVPEPVLEVSDALSESAIEPLVTVELVVERLPTDLLALDALAPPTPLTVEPLSVGPLPIR